MRPPGQMRGPRRLRDTQPMEFVGRVRCLGSRHPSRPCPLVGRIDGPSFLGGSLATGHDFLRSDSQSWRQSILATVNLGDSQSCAHDDVGPKGVRESAPAAAARRSQVHHRRSHRRRDHRCRSASGHRCCQTARPAAVPPPHRQLEGCRGPRRGAPLTSSHRPTCNALTHRRTTMISVD
jgi:hypothetical protein